MKRHTILGIAVLALCSIVGSAHADGPRFPDRPIRLVLGFPPGGSSDVVARLLAKRLTEQMNVAVIVENKPGAGASIAAMDVARSRPDGYTLLYATSSVVLTPSLYKVQPFNPIADFTPISMVATAPLVMVVNPSFPARDVREFIAYARSHRGMPYATTGIGINSHLAGEQFDMAFGLGMTPVAYRGGAPAMTDVAAGHIGMMFNVITDTLSQVKAGRVRALAVLSAQRSPLLPDVPTLAEAAGRPGLEVGAWHVVLGPKGLPTGVVARLEKEIGIAVNDPAFKSRLLELGSESLQGDSNAAASYMKVEYEKWGKLIHDLKITAE
jgi:tripartite-type tricarboxylate transporter receptor subunit TctC